MTEIFNTFIIATIGRPSLKKSIESVLAQDKAGNHKVIVIFDNCKINKCVNDERVIYLRTEENVWGTGARNFGIDYIKNNNITTTYISFLDDDDYITNDYAEVLYSHRKYDLVIHTIDFPWHPVHRRYLPPKKGTGIKRGEIGVAISVRGKKLIDSNIKYDEEAAADFFFAQKLLDAKFKHFKTGKVTYIAPTHGNLGAHTNKETIRFN